MLDLALIHRKMRSQFSHNPVVLLSMEKATLSQVFITLDWLQSEKK